MGVARAAIFGSEARGDAGESSDIDVLVDLDGLQDLGIFEYSRIKFYIGELLNGAGVVVNRRTVKRLLKDNILRDAVSAF